ncbi:MAG: helix-turn-helix domain-containing protein, partial [Desulfobacterales bacterium]
ADRFREDLWFRLNVFPIEIPPLQERTGDIPALVQHFVERKARELKLGETPELAPGEIDRLHAYAWPGNVRELENLIERIAIMAETEEIETTMLPVYLFRNDRTAVQSATHPEGSSQLEIMEKEALLSALARNEWAQNKAAVDIGLTLRQMGYRVKKYNLGPIIKENKKSRTSGP